VPLVASALAPFLVILTAGVPARPWEARKPPSEPPRIHELRSPESWPPEPPSPNPIDPAKFREALAYVCNRPVDKVPADDVLAAAEATGVDPFLLGGLMFDRSRCDPRRKLKGVAGVGLLAIQPGLYRSEGAPPPPVDKKQFTRRALMDSRQCLATGAKLLKMWEESHGEIDETFGGVAHRSGVAHFIWGDRVKSSGGEDMVLTARRRIIARYDGVVDSPLPTSIGLSMVSPLEGWPRVASSGPGEDRDGGMRRHRGIDISATVGEPVRSIASGKVIFAGANMKGAPRRGPIPPNKIARYRNRRLGAGGIYLCIKHDLSEGATVGEVVSCYMHLDRYVVAAEEKVSPGQLLGYVGRTGVKVSPPHLHLEIRVDDKARNPLRYLTSQVIPPKETKAHRWLIANKRAKARAARAARTATARITPTKT
jgi:hypothetical protein